MRKSFYVVSDGYNFSSHKTKEDAIAERELNKLDGWLDKYGHKSKWYIKKIKGYSTIYGGCPVN